MAQQIAFEANNIRVLLDRIATTRTKRGRNKLLTQATSAARRALLQLQREPLVQSTAAYVNDTCNGMSSTPGAFWRSYVWIERRSVGSWEPSATCCARADLMDG